MPVLLSIRRALKSDYEEVMAIDRDVFTGLDYLPAKYHNLIANPRNYAFVGLLNGEIIAFVIYYLIDEGKTLIGKSGRVKKEFRNKHYINDFGRKAKDVICSLHNNVSTVDATTQRDITSLSSYISQKIKLPVVVDPVKLKGLLPSAIFQRKLNEIKHAIYLQVLTPTQAFFTLSSLNAQCFVPDNRWLVCFDPYKPTPYNHQIMIEDHNPTVVTGHAVESGKEITSISFAVEYPCKLGYKYNISFHYNTKRLHHKEVKQHVLAHFMKHLILLKQKQIKCKALPWLYMSDDKKVLPDVREFLSTTFGLEMPTNMQTSPLHLLGSDFLSSKI